MEKDVVQTITDLLNAMGFSEAGIKVKPESEEEGVVVNIEAKPEDSGILIGHHGEGIDAIQLIVNLTINKDKESWTRVTININDYRQQREELVTNMALNAAQNAKTTGKSVILNYLPSHERRIAHMVLSKDLQIETYSEGVGKYRRLVINPLPSPTTE